MLGGRKGQRALGHRCPVPTCCLLTQLAVVVGPVLPLRTVNEVSFRIAPDTSSVLLRRALCDVMWTYL